jgi:cytochrome c-type protein NapC
VVGIGGSGLFAVTMHFTGTDEFCSSCHTHDVVPEWKQSVHYVNPAGVRAGCGDCHDPSNPVGLFLRKIQGLNELWHQFRGTIGTPEKFEANRLRMAQVEWTRMRADNSQNCQNCHHLQQMQSGTIPTLSVTHRTSIANGKACIDCHKGIAHKAPSEPVSPQHGALNRSLAPDLSAVERAKSGIKPTALASRQ